MAEVSSIAVADGGEETLAERAFAGILAEIMGGRLAPGSPLNEVDLARRLSMSRGPVREALRRLEGWKLVVREPYQRARLISLGPEEVREMFEFREPVEGMACRLAARSLSDEAFEEISRLLEASKASGWSDGFDFHREIAARCGNSRIASFLCNDFYYVTRLYRRWSGEMPGRHDEAHQEHRQILMAMRARDGELAESLMRSHIRRAADQLKRKGTGEENG